MNMTLDPITESRNSCRICLEENATIPIFDVDNMRVLVMFNNWDAGRAIKSIDTRAFACDKDNQPKEELEQVPGFPELVCAPCYKTIETASSFIERYRETQQTLQHSVKIVKQEYIDEDDFNFPETDSIEDDIFVLQYTNNIYDEDDIKIKPKCNDENPLSTNILIKNNKLKEKTTSGPKTNTKRSKKKTNIFGALDINALFKDRPNLTIVKMEKIDKLNKSNSVLQWNVKNWCTMKNRIKGAKETTVVKKENNIKTPTICKECPKNVYLCDECGENFVTNDHLRRHKARHLVPVVCNICNKNFLNQKSLTSHIKDIHNSEQVICPICARILKNKKSLLSHIRFMHEGRAKKKLPRCLCTLCDKTFVNKKYLVMHMRSVHTGERPEICKVCGTSFTHKDYLKEHMRLHTGETPYKCPVCGRGYAQRCNMKSHIVHNHRLFQIDPELLAKIKPNYTRLMKP